MYFALIESITAWLLAALDLLDTTTLTLLENEPSLALTSISATPLLTPVTTPLASTVATLAFFETNSNEERAYEDG